MTREEKERMLRIAKRPRKGPFNSIVDPTEFGAGSAVIGVTEAVKNSGQFDPLGCRRGRGTGGARGNRTSSKDACEGSFIRLAVLSQSNISRQASNAYTAPKNHRGPGSGRASPWNII